MLITDVQIAGLPRLVDVRPCEHDRPIKPDLEFLDRRHLLLSGHIPEVVVDPDLGR